MKKLLIATVLIFSFVSLSYCADNFQKGYIITLGYDTIHGWIDLGTNKVNAVKCVFKDRDSGIAATYLPGEINAYYVPEEDKCYVSHTVTVQQEEHVLFLELLVDGIMNLYSYEMQGANYFFFEDESGKMTSIWKRGEEWIREFNRDRRVLTDRRYEDRLKEIFKDLESVANRETDIPFNQKTMVEFTKLYHNEVCTSGEDCIVYVNEKPDNTGFRLKFSLYAGVQHVAFTYDVREVEMRGGTSTPVYGAQVILYNDRFSRYFSFLYDFSYSKYNVTGNPEMAPKYLADQYCNFALKSDAIFNKLGARYTYINPSRFYPTVEVGVQYTQLFIKSFEFYRFGNMIDGEIAYPSVDRERELKQFTFGAYVSAGCDFKLSGRSNAVFLRGTLDLNLKDDSVRDGSTSHFGVWSIKAGYIF